MVEKIIRIEELMAKRDANQFVGTIGSWYENAACASTELGQLFINNPTMAVEKIPDFIMKVRDSAGEGSHAYEALTGGANPDWTGRMIDVVGEFYPTLSRSLRVKALKHTLGFIDLQNYMVAQDNVRLINEPALVRDILVNRSLYWCGCSKYVDLLEQNPEWTDLYPKLEKIASAFWMAFAVSQPKCSSEDIRNNFYAMFPTLIKGTQNAIAGLTYVRAQDDFLTKGIPVAQGVESRLFRYDRALWDGIKAGIKAKDWIDLDEPVYMGSDTDTHWAYRSSIGKPLPETIQPSENTLRM